MLCIVAVAPVLLAVLTACATKPARDFGGRWKPVNRYAESTMEIPLYSSYVFQASPTDGTLKRMLERWSQDTKMTLSYSATADFTLYGPVASISTTSLHEAVAQLNSAYGAQGISVSSDSSQILVRPVAPDGG